MKFAVMMHTNPTHSKALRDEEVSSIEAKHAKLIEELVAAGELINGAGLNFRRIRRRSEWPTGGRRPRPAPSPPAMNT